MKLRSFFYVIVLLLFVNTFTTAQQWTDLLPQKDESDLTFYDYQNAFNEYWSQYEVIDGYFINDNGVNQKAGGWKQFKRWENYWESRVDMTTGVFPEFLAQDMIDKYYDPPQGLTSGLGVANWTSMGPSASTGGYAGVGRINCVAFHPVDINTFWVGAASGGIWKTTNGGSSWTVLNNGTGVLAVSDIIIPLDYVVSNTIYIATGDRDGWDNRSIGVLKSTDGGVTWNTTDLAYTVAQGKMVSRMLVNPLDDQTIIASTRDGVYKTTDGGTNWSTQLTTERFLDIEYKPGDFNTLYGGTKYDGEVWRSTDGGLTWANTLNTSGSRVEVAVSAEDASVVYALVSASNNSLLGVYKSTDSGATFTQVYDGTAANQNMLGWYTNGSDSGGQGWYDLSLEANPLDADMVFVGGVNTWKSSDGGTTFAAINCWTSYSVYNTTGVAVVHADKHKLRYRINGDLYECNDGGIYISSDDGTTWADKTNGMVISQMYKIGVAQTVSDDVITGLQDNGSKNYSAGTWTDVIGGDGMECAIDYTDANIQYGELYYGRIKRTTNHWASYTGIQPSGSSGAWVTPFVIDPIDHNTLYGGYEDIYKSTNQGTNWTKISAINSGSRFRSLAVAPSNTQYIYAGERYTIWKTTNGGTNWTDITAGLPSGDKTYITVKDDDPNTLWVTLSNYSGTTVYESTNAGGAWANITSGLPSVPVNSIIQNKLVTDQVDLYVATDNGVYYKAGAANWVPFNTGLPNVEVRELDIYYDSAIPENSLMRAGSYGRGLWESPIIAACAVTITQSDEGTCNDNGTDMDPSDDWFDIIFNATELSGGASDKYEVVLDANVDGTGGTVLNTGGTTYGTPVTVGTSLNPPFVADGATTYNITIRDFDYNTCHSDYTTTVVASCSNAIADCSEVFISEYVEGGGSNKCLELYNPTANPIDLHAGVYKILRYANGTTTPTQINFSVSDNAIIQPYDVYVVCNPNAGASFLALADKTTGTISHNGDDAYELTKNGVVIDAFGKVGEDPGSAWIGGGCTTKDRTLVRKATILTGDNDSSDAFDPSVEWTCYPKDTDTELGNHTSDCYTPPPPCSLAIDQSDEGSCNDNGTNNDASDDWFSITFDASATDGGATNKYEVVLNANVDGTGGTVLNTGGTTYGTPITVGTSTTPPFKADGSTTYEITVRDIDDPTCHADYTTSTVASCSVPPPCAVTIDQSDEGFCNNNGTNDDASDDWFNITFNASAISGGVTDKYEVVLNANIDGTGGTILNTGGTTYGTPVTVGTSTTPPFSADGSSIYAITIRDIDDNTCHADYNTSTVSSCSTGSITIDNSGGPTIADPCTCAGNGEFDEEVVVHSVTGEVWLLSANTGYLDPTTMIEFPIGTSLVETPTGSGNYTLVGKHLDDVGYSISVELLSDGGPITLSISNECWYPIAQIDNLPGSVCPTATPFTLAGSAQLGDNAGAATVETEMWVGPGVSSGIFTPALAGLGLHTIIYTFDAMDDNPTEHHPGCSDEVVQQVFVGDVIPPMFDEQLACEILSCGNPMPTNLPTAIDNCDGAVTVTEEAIEDIADYTCAGEFLVFGMQDQPFIPYGLYGHGPIAPQFTLDLTNINGIGAYCDAVTGKHIYGMWQDPTDRPSLTNSPDVYFVDVNPYTGKSAIMGTIAAPALLNAGANETAVSYALHGIGDVGGDNFYMAGVAMLVDNTTNEVTDFKLYKGTIGLSICPPIGNPIPVVYEEINLDMVCGVLLINFINDLSAFINGTGGEPSGGIQDWAVSPDGLTLYAFMGVENAIMSIDMATSAAVCTPADQMNFVNGYVGSTGSVTDEFAGMYYDDGGVLHGFQSDRGRIFSIDIVTGTLTLVDDSLPIDQRGDAASCTDCTISTIVCPEISRTKRVFRVEDAFGNVNYQYQLVTTIDVVPPVFDMQLACDTISCGDAMPTNMPTAIDNCGGTITVTEEPSEDVSDYTCNGDFLVFGMQDQPFLPYGLYGHTPFAPQFVLDLNNINGIGTYCTEQSGKHIYGLWQDPIDKPSLTNVPDVYFVEVNAYTGKTAVMGTIAAPALLSVGAGQTAVSYAMNGLGDVGGDEFYMAGVALLIDDASGTILDFKLYKGTIGINLCPPMGGTIPVVYDEITLDAMGTVLLANFANSLSAFLNGTGGEPSGGIQDWAVSSDGSTLYAFMGIENALMAIDIATNAETTTPGPASNVTNGYTGTSGAVTDEFAGMYYNDAGILHGYQSDRGRIYSIDIITGTLTLVDDTLPIDQRGDAASCFDCDASAIACPMIAKTKRVFKATDACGNVNYQYQLVYEIDDTEVSLNDPDDECENGSDMLFTGVPTDANGVFTTTAPSGFTDNGDGTAVLDVSVAGDGTFKVYYTYNKNGECCPKTDSVEVTVLETPDEPIVDDITVCEGESTLIVPQSTGGSGGGGACLATEDLVISGVIDGPLSGGVPKAVEFYVVNDIADLSAYGFGSANNGNGGGVEEFTFPADAVTAGTYIWVASNVAGFNDFFGFNPTYTSNAASINGDDAIELFHNGGVIDVFGDIDTDGSGEPWEYLDGWAYRVMDTGEDGTTFVLSNWTYSGPNALDGETNNATATTPFPISTYTCTLGTNPPLFNFYSDAGLTNLLAGPVASYDPMTTVANSPQSIWVTELNSTTGCESNPVEVIITVYEQPFADAGDNQMFCDIPASVSISAIANYSGQWTTSGAGSIANATSATTTYTPDATDVGTTVVMIWTTSAPDGVGCIEAIDSMGITIVPPTEDAEFTYGQEEFCPDAANPTVTHITGVDGIYTYVVVSDGPNLVIDKHTGEIDMATSDWGTYDVTNTVDGRGNLIITGVIDGPITGGLPKAIELYAIQDITDLSRYGLERAANNNSSNGVPSFTFPDDAVAAGTYFWVSRDIVEFNNFFGFDPTYTNIVANINGNDAIILYNDGQVIDVFGEVGQNNNIGDWNYQDGWAYRNNNTGPDGTVFTVDNWSFSGPNALDGFATNAAAGADAFPISSFTTTYTGTCDATTHTERIIVGDLIPPVVNCPPDQTVYLDGGDCGVFLWYDDPDVFDNCDPDPEIVKVSGPDKGDEFTLLGTPYTIVFEVTDQYGNGPVTCSFDIAIEGYPNPVEGILVCNDVVQISLDSTCNINMNADNFLEGGPYQCYNMFEVFVDDPDYAGVNVSNWDIHLDPGTYMVTVGDAAAIGNTCMTVMIVMDKIMPELECNCPEGGEFPSGMEWVGSMTGDFSDKDLTYGIHAECYNFGTMEVLPDHGAHYYDSYAIEVSADGDYDLSVSAGNGKAIVGVYETYFNSAEVCNYLYDGSGGYFAGLFGTFYSQANTTVYLESGKKYYIVVSDFDELYIGNYTVTLVPPTDEHVYFAEGVYSNECILSGCYDETIDYTFIAPLAIDNCEVEVELISSEVLDGGTCGVQKILNTWQGTDIGGNIARCTQEYIFQGVDMANLSWPRHFDDLPLNNSMLECNSGYAVDGLGNPDPGFTGYPEGWASSCGSTEMFYIDEVHNLDCGVKILRRWVVVDDCTGAVYEHVQVIRITDKTSPTFMSGEDIAIKTKGYICNSNLEVPAIMHLEDNCDAYPRWWVTTDLDFAIDGDINGNGYVDITESWTILNIPMGVYTLCYHSIDNCGNEVDQCITITVFDGNPPVAVCEQYKQVSLTAMGNSKVNAYSFDSGSFDNCNPVYFKVLRVSDDLEYDGGCENLNGDDKQSTSPIDVWYDDEVFFCCEDTDTEVMTSLRVFEVNPGAGAVDPKRMLPGGDLYGHYNDCWSVVTVECKIPPAMECSPITVSCEESLDPEENPRLMPQIISVCGHIWEYEDKRDLGVCGAKITRTWTVTGCEQSTSCKQKITVESTTEFDPCTIKFPRDVQSDCSKDLKDGKEPTWDEFPCNVVTSEVIHEDTFNFVDGACYKIVREWAVIDWCVYEPNTGAEDNVDAISGTKLNCSQLVVDGYYRYTQILMVTDFIPPTITVADACIATTDCYAYGAKLEATATDSCNTDQKFWWKYIVTNMDTWETVQYSYNYVPKPTTGTKGKRSKDDLDKVTVGQLEILDPLSIGNYRVTWTVGDGCGNANSTNQYFEVADKKAPTPILVDIATALMTNCMVEICAITFDKGGCNGNCISSRDNCTEKVDLYFTFSDILPDLSNNPLKWAKQYSKYGRYFYNPLTGAISTEEKYFFGEAFAWDPTLKTSCRVYGIDRDGNGPRTTQKVKVYVWDQFALNEDCDDNNYDYAESILALNDSSEDCPDAGSLVSGMVMSCSEYVGVSEVKLSFDNGESVSEIVNESTGLYSADIGDDTYTVRASKQTEGLEGITTLDIVMIQKHILGLDEVEDVCKYAAMDMNGDGRVSASDILRVRNLILGYDEAVVNWNFMDEGYMETHTDASHYSLKDSYSKVIRVEEGETADNTNFRGVYAGDVNLSGSHLEGRNSEDIEILIEDIEIEAGEMVEVPVFARDFAEVFGAQFTMSISSMQLEEIVSGAINIGNHNYNVVDGNLVMSWNTVSKLTVGEDEVLFTLVLKSEDDGRLSEMLGLSDGNLRSEVYIGEELEIRSMILDIRSSEFEYTLYQNKPNPFSEETKIGFDLPTSDKYTVTIFDVTGKLIREYNYEGEAGYNVIAINRRELGSSNVMYYRLESGDFTDTKKMILLK